MNRGKILPLFASVTCEPGQKAYSVLPRLYMSRLRNCCLWTKITAFVFLDYTSVVKSYTIWICNEEVLDNTMTSKTTKYMEELMNDYLKNMVHDVGSIRVIV